MIAELDVVRWVHIIAMVYWLGGEWGVFQTSYHVTNPKLSLDERRRHMETAYRIDILARTGIVLLLPLGLHMGKLYGFVPVLDGPGLWIMWTFFIAWLTMTWAAFIKRETDIGIRITMLEEKLRYPLILIVAGIAIMSFYNEGPIQTTEGTRWYPAKMLLYSFTLCIGLFLRWVMRRWTVVFRKLAQGPDAAAETALKREVDSARYAAYLYWITIAGICFLGATKPF